MSLTIDVHCHTFNADDLPVRGFLERVAFHNVDLARDVAALADILIQGKAPGFVEEKAHLDALLARAAGGGPEAAIIEPPPFDAGTEEVLARLAASEPALIRRIGVQATGGSEVPAPGPEGLGAWWGASKRIVSFVRLFGMRRIEITSNLVRNFGRDEVDLFTPMLVDLGMGVHDTERTTMAQQVELHEKISRLSMLGRLPGTSRSQVHPFIGFDPRREMVARRHGDVERPLQLLEKAVRDYGFVGVKVYPPMGWRPTRNTATLDMTAAEAAEIDEILGEFYGLCEGLDIPITAHCNTSNGAHSDYHGFSDPSLWRVVLEGYPGLHLNLGHFGGTASAAAPAGWPWAIAAMATELGGHLYADVGCHGIHREANASAYLDALEAMFEAPGTSGMRHRLMYGSDWFMLASSPEHDKFLERYRQLFERFDDDVRASFAGRAARSFLGFDEEQNQNRQRLVARYEMHTPGQVPTWLTDDLRP